MYVCVRVYISNSIRLTYQQSYGDNLALHRDQIEEF